MIRNIKGTQDLLPPEIHHWQAAEEHLRQIFQAFSYSEIRTPVFEKTELFARGIGEFTDIVTKEMYTFKDKGDLWLTLRPEFTASVIRAYIQHNLAQSAPLQRLWYVGPLFRQERPQAGRMRQFHQFGVEIIGSEHPEADAEVIHLAWTAYEKLGVKGKVLHINSIGSQEARKDYIGTLQETLRPHLEAFCPQCQERFSGNSLRLFDCKNENCQSLMKAYAPSILDHLDESDAAHFEKVKELLAALKVPYTVNPALVRGLDYYTRTTFEVKGLNLGAQDALCGGGRYDQLVQDLGGKPTPSVGFAAGFERLLLAIAAEKKEESEPDGPTLFLAPFSENELSFAFEIMGKVREAGISAEMDLLRRSMKAKMREANRLNARFVALIGPDEMRQNKVSLKNMKTSQQTLLDAPAIISFLQKL
ncbi:MAG TPA: histidine--tRNA ligase [Candidatus Marinimicrobia bacterium]|nr:histidine--tRNA ligase [Candidatus Neomarinimicrobiota bacterium]